MDDHTELMAFTWRLAGKNRQTYSYMRLGNGGGFFGRTASKRRRARVERLGSRSSSGSGRRRSWRLKMPKIRIRVLSPLSLFARFRNAYVAMMMKLASSRNLAGTSLGPMGDHKVPARITDTSTNPKGNNKLFTDAELMYLDYLRRDMAYLRPVVYGPR